jgi:hypothetical protein
MSSSAPYSFYRYQAAIEEGEVEALNNPFLAAAYVVKFLNYSFYV